MARGAHVALGRRSSACWSSPRMATPIPQLDATPGVMQLRERASRARPAQLQQRRRARGARTKPARRHLSVVPDLGRQFEPGRSAARWRLARRGAGAQCAGTRQRLGHRQAEHRARAKLSRIKGGGIARLLRGRRALALFISDVPGDDPDVIGSGLLGRDAGIADGIERHVVATIETAVRAVQDGRACARPRARSGVRRVSTVMRARSQRSSSRDCAPCECDGLVWGGESTVTLPAASRARRPQYASGTELRAAAARRRTVDAARRGHRWHRRPDRRRGRHRRCGNDRARRRSRAATSSARGASSIPAPRSKPRKISCTPGPPARMSGIS